MTVGITMVSPTLETSSYNIVSIDGWPSIKGKVRKNHLTSSFSRLTITTRRQEEDTSIIGFRYNEKVNEVPNKTLPLIVIATIVNEFFRDPY